MAVPRMTINWRSGITVALHRGTAGFVNVTVTMPVEPSAIAAGNQFTYTA